MRETPSRWIARTLRGVAPVAALLAALFTVTPAAAQTADAPQATAAAAGGEKAKPSTKTKCLRCHDDPELKTEDGKNSMAVLEADYHRSAHRKLDCAECHDAALSVRHPDNALGPVKPQVCQDCHADEFKAIAGSVHGRRAAGAKAVKDCMSCHDSLHTVHKSGDPASNLSPINQIRTCGGCHEEMMVNYEGSEHGRALLRAGLTQASPACASCHGKHDIHSKTDPSATTHHFKEPQTCGSCHTAILAQWESSAHGRLWKEANGGDKAKEGPVCSSCHTPHAVKHVDTAKVRHEVADRCGDCHTRIVSTFNDSFHGKAVTLNNRKAAACADCHTPHQNLAKSDPKSSVHPDNLAKTCGSCHKNVNASFLTFDPHSNPADPTRNIYVHWIYLGMTSLLIGVFAFFGLHGALWLQRSIVGKLRGEFQFGHAATGPHVRRFANMQIAVHVTIVLSFLLLAGTGLPLKFADATWAPNVIAVFGGAEGAAVLHRMAGAVTFGYFVWHLGMLVYGWFRRHEHDIFWGPHSMVPQPQDVRDLFGMFKYFLYLGPRPKFDRFTYWEKFDYLAVFWGVAIIGTSGLMLWLPNVTSSVLPGWALNAAYVVHSDEALLATGFIFLFHFFHTHLRPESFPLDPVIFTGRMPLERFKEERPLEYERLVAEGKLEALMAPPPTKGEMRRAYLFGFTALTIGVALAVFILWALLGQLLGH